MAKARLRPPFLRRLRRILIKQAMIDMQIIVARTVRQEFEARP